MQSSAFSHHNRELDLLVMVMIGGVNSLIMRTFLWFYVKVTHHNNAVSSECSVKEMCLLVVCKTVFAAGHCLRYDRRDFDSCLDRRFVAFTSIVVCAVCVCVFRFD